MSKLNQYLEAVKEKKTPPKRLNSLIQQVKEEIEEQIKKGRRVDNSDINSWIKDAVGENYEYGHEYTSRDQIKEMRETLIEYRDKLIKKKGWGI